MTTKAFSILAVTLALLFGSFATQATPIKATYTVNLNDTDPGLVLHTEDVADNPFYAELNPGDSISGALFRIWSDETNVNNDDAASKPISVDFDFILPQIFSGSVTGTTVGGDVTICFIWCADVDGGKVTWDGPTDVYFGPNNSGHIILALSDEDVVLNPFDVVGGKILGATVNGTMTLVSNATAVPAPAGFALFGFALLSLGLFLRRQRRS